MNIAAVPDISRRAALHAALAEPVRLAIVDALTLGDASPSELGAVLGVPSNLLAHHLRVLEAAGILARTRSEGDRRRSYLRQVPGVLDATHFGTARAVGRVVFVCSANSARSQLASALWRRASRVPVASAGTRPAPQINPAAIEAARRHALPLRRVKPRRLDEIRQAGDFVITVCDHAHEELGQSPDLHWSVPDPVRDGTPDSFDGALAELSRRVSGLAPRLTLADAGF